jgi:hypothetical protein
MFDLKPLTDIRKAALITCIASVFGLLIPMWNATRTIIEVESTRAVSNWWVAPMSALVVPLAAVMPMFYFTLYRNEGTLRFPRRLRLVSLTAALVFSMVVAAELLEWIESQGPYWTAMKALDWSSGGASAVAALGDLGKIRRVSTLLDGLADISVILVLVAIFRQAPSEESSTDVPVSRLLSVVTKVAIVMWGIWVAFSFLRVAITPYTYSQLRNFDLQGRTLPSLAQMMADAIRTFLGQACLFTTPYIVHKCIIVKRSGTS